MRILDWNCRGICNASTVRALKAQIKGTRPNILFLSETKAKVGRMESVKSSLKFDHFMVVEAKGKAGGLCMLWKKGIFNCQLCTECVGTYTCELEKVLESKSPREVEIVPLETLF